MQYQFEAQVLTQLRAHPLTARLFEEAVRPVHSCPLEEEPVPVLALDPKDPRITQAKEEADLDPYLVSDRIQITGCMVNEA